jgi:hypothetical protein
MWVAHRIACLTYHKHPKDQWPAERFTKHDVSLVNGEIVEMRLAEDGTWVASQDDGMRMREIRRLTESGHQTSIICTVFKPPMEKVAPQMSARWCQENFFRHMMEHFAIDLLAEYDTEPFHGTEKVVNPAWRDSDVSGAVKTRQ